MILNHIVILIYIYLLKCVHTLYLNNHEMKKMIIVARGRKGAQSSAAWSSTIEESRAAYLWDMWLTQCKEVFSEVFGPLGF